MGKKGKGKRRKSGVRASTSGSQTSESTSAPVKKSEEKDCSIQEGEKSKKNVTGDQEIENKGKNEATGEVQSVVPVAKNIKKSGESTDKLKKDNKAAKKLMENVSSKMELRSKGKELQIAGIERQVDVSSRPLRDQCCLTRAAVVTAATICTPLSELLQTSKGKNTDEQKSDLDLKASNSQQNLSLENEMKAVEPKVEVNKPIPILQCSEGTNEQNSTPMLQCFEDIKKQKVNSGILKSSEVQQTISAEIEGAKSKPNIDVNESTPLEIDERKESTQVITPEVKLGIALEKERENIEAKYGVNESPHTSEVSEVMDIDERLRNLYLNVPQVQDLASENIKKMNELNIEEHDDTINLERDVNLRFEFDTFGSKKISVDDEIFYDIKEKQKMTFDIGGGDVQLSFLGNNVFIFTQRSKIDLSIQNNQIIFSITDRTESRDTSDTASAVDDFVPFEIYPEGDSGNIKQSIPKAISSSAEKYVEQCLQNITEKFLSRVRTSCEKFEISFLESLKGRSQDKHKK